MLRPVRSDTRIRRLCHRDIILGPVRRRMIRTPGLVPFSSHLLFGSQGLHTLFVSSYIYIITHLSLNVKSLNLLTPKKLWMRCRSKIKEKLL